MTKVRLEEILGCKNTNFFFKWLIILILHFLSLKHALARIWETNIRLAIPSITQQMDMVTASQQCVESMAPWIRDHIHALQHICPFQPLLQPPLFLRQPHQVGKNIHFWKLKKYLALSHKLDQITNIYIVCLNRAFPSYM